MTRLLHPNYVTKIIFHLNLGNNDVNIPLLRLRFLLLATVLLHGSGCASFSYYLDVVNGHANVINQQRPVTEVLNDPQTSEELRQALINIQQARDFAVTELHLPDNDSYRYYADIQRKYATWNVVATPRLSVQAKQWCFLFAGCLNYRGFFSEQDAEEYAEKLQRQDYDIYVAGSRAYSTLGWFDDPLLNTMMYRSEASRVGVVFHELAHQKIYISDDSAFNEGFAVFLQQEGVRRWFRYRQQEKAYRDYLKTNRRRQQFNQLLLQTRQKLAEVYASDLDTAAKLQRKQQLFDQLKKDYQIFKQKWQGYDGYDAWMRQDLNNAHLALVATYHQQVNRFARLLAYHRGDLENFYASVRRLGNLTRQQRKQRLQEIEQGEFAFFATEQEKQ